MDEFAVKEDAVPIATPFPLADAELPETELYVIVLLIAVICELSDTIRAPPCILD